MKRPYLSFLFFQTNLMMTFEVALLICMKSDYPSACNTIQVRMNKDGSLCFAQRQRLSHIEMMILALLF